ncbi:MAG: hypothetical protein K0R26_650 [Bacteroidota bacterium]|jgi:hypothetical protein|nr:hypothetical protein [Bacteroidota bacterium]
MQKIIKKFKEHALKFFVFAALSLFLHNCKPYYDAFYTDPEKCFRECYFKRPYDVVIIPGYPYDSLGTNDLLEQRVKWASFLYKRGFTHNVIFSGGAVHSPYVESEIMRLYALKLGIDSSHIFTESNAKHTTENLYYSYKLAEKSGFQKIAFASQAAQTSFMKPFKRKFKLNVDFLPLLEDSLKTLEITINTIDARRAFKPDFIPLRQQESIFQNLRGTRGKEVKLAIQKEKKSIQPYK